MPATPVLRLGTRGSPLALAQARETAARLAAVHGWGPGAVEIVPIRTTGDAITDRSLAEAGGKGLFTRELDAALLAGRIDLAVHSAKDVPTYLPDGIALAGYLPREDPRDALIGAPSLAALPPGARVGTASLRREALIRRARPDVTVELLRGNVGTRLAKLAAGTMDATVLALAGLRRLGLEAHATGVLPEDEFLPAVGQGAIGIAARAGDAATGALLAPVLDEGTGLELAAERAFLAVLDGSCRTPIAGLARVRDGRVAFRGLVLSPDGRVSFAVEREGTAMNAAALGAEAGASILARLPGGALPAGAPPGVEDAGEGPGPAPGA